MYLLAGYLKASRFLFHTSCLVAHVSAPHAIEPNSRFWENGPAEVRPTEILSIPPSESWPGHRIKPESDWDSHQISLPSGSTGVQSESPASPALAPSSTPTHRFFKDVSLDPQPVERKRKYNGQLKDSTSNPNPTSSTSAGSSYTLDPASSAFNAKKFAEEHRGLEPLAKKHQNDHSVAAPTSNPNLTNTPGPAVNPGLLTSPFKEDIEEYPVTEPITSQSLISSYGRRHYERGQLSDIEKALDHPSDSIEITLAERQSEQRSLNTRRLYSELSKTGPRALSRKGKLSILLLNQYQDNFNGMVALDQFAAGAGQKILYYGLPYGKVDPASATPGFVLRILRYSDHLVQPADNMIVLHKRLIKWIYKIHERLLNNLDIPTQLIYQQQKKMLDWLHAEMFTYFDGAPLIGLKQSTRKRWEDKDTLGRAKLELIHFFCGYRNDDLFVFSTAFNLIDMFKDHQSLHYPTLDLPLRESTQIRATDPHFEETRIFLLRLAERQNERFDPLFKQRYKAPNDDLMSLSISFFSQACSTQPNLRNQNMGLHPRLSMSIYFLHNSPGYGVLRMLSQNHREVIQLEELSIFFKRLIRGINYIHVEILERLRLNSNKKIKRRRNLFKWLLEIIFNPPHNRLPILGNIRLNNADLAPWEDNTYGKLELFTPVQLSVIDFFSREQSTTNLQNQAAFILNTWYQEKHQTKLSALLENSRQ
ncbi:hypothetical protein PGTUg99_017086 [Puccinia graminis f. sp. tritici]|uniref:Uncharacterized protein n=2 Tax=Puccinia graminis f. sp. tritici TaxID=56615 RepID=E3KWW8_PUCGT|nr:uncharacterized protein PGTG_14200 [Puccinia graminis f. sp. tritici CRL 75-36-700-3]EFP88861.1 hypothetical protein PGTG_14200 [Puccinia graminis f. sp. tritici CRL 75-36-700-3]KAA1113660.1 hypothetical protein PGTUg99_017086 [Puccinia graminis f. sp. tritici]